MSHKVLKSSANWAFFITNIRMPLSIFLCLFFDTIRLVSIKNKIKSHYTLRNLTNFLHKFNRTVLSKCARRFGSVNSDKGCSISYFSLYLWWFQGWTPLDTSRNLTLLCIFSVCYIQITKLDNSDFYDRKSYRIDLHKFASQKSSW